MDQDTDDLGDKNIKQHLYKKLRLILAAGWKMDL